MEHISNMGYSLDAIKYFVELQVAKWLPSVDIHYKETYPFRNEVAYKQEVAEYRIKYNCEDLNKILKQHFSTCEQIIKIWDERLELWEARSRLIKGRENDVEVNITHEIYCTLGGRKNNIRRFYGDILLLRINNEKIEIGNPFIWSDMSWHEYDSKLRPKPNTDKEVLSAHLVPFAKDIKSFLSEYVSNEEDLQTIEQPQPVDQHQQKLGIPPDVRTWLQDNICTNGKAYIEDAMAEPLRWLQNKQLARELLTHDKIRGSLIKAEVERQTPNIFIYYRNGKPLILAKPNKKPSADSDNLDDYLATL